MPSASPMLAFQEDANVRTSIIAPETIQASRRCCGCLPLACQANRVDVTRSRVMIAQRLVLAIDFNAAIRDLDRIAPRILVIGHEQPGWCRDRRVVPELELKHFALDIKR